MLDSSMHRLSIWAVSPCSTSDDNFRTDAMSFEILLSRPMHTTWLRVIGGSAIALWNVADVTDTSNVASR